MQNNALNWMFDILDLNPEQHLVTAIKDTNWRKLYKIQQLETKHSYYLKQTQTLTVNESEIIQYLSTISDHIVPIIYQNNELNCFITEQYGEPLAPYSKETLNYKIILRSLLNYVHLQYSANTNILEDLGCERLEMESILPKFLYKLLLLQSNDQENADYLFAILKNTSVIHEYIKELRDLNIPYTLGHNDFTTRNVLCVEQTTKLIDFADVFITCPLFSLCTYISSVAQKYRLPAEDDFIISLYNSYIMNVKELTGISRHTLNKGLQLANFLYPIYYIATIPDHKLEEALTKDSICALKIKQELYNMTKTLLKRRDELWN